ncbi:MAG: transporter [Anaerolineae bacterium]|nr:transporter [Anaerolineae bacterium]
MIQLLIDNPLLLLFLIAALAYPLGRIKIKGVSLGVSAVLFVGLAVGALDPELKLPEIIYTLGLVLFVYTIGLSSGPGFFASFRRKGLRDNLLVLVMLVLAAALAALAVIFVHPSPAVAAGLFTGSLTNTPALAGVLELIKGYAPPEAVDQLLAEPVLGYSVAYPIGVIGVIVVIAATSRAWRVDYAREAESLRELGQAQQLRNRTLLVTQPGAARATIQELVQENKWDVVFGRVRHDGQVSLATGQTQLGVGDLVSLVGTEQELERATMQIGEPSDEQLELDRRDLDYRRVFVSNPKIAGMRLRDLNLPQQYGAIVTRVRRGDIEWLAHEDTVLEPGDRVRIVTRRENMDAVGKFFGDSYRAVSEIDILSFSLGLGLGLLVGLIPIPLSGGITFKLGIAGGPLIVALILGTRQRTGPFVWTLPYSANLTLRQFGLILFLAGIGTRAGYAFVSTLSQSGGPALLVAGALITLLTAFATLFIGYRLLKIPMGLLVGILAGLQTNPAVLGFATEQTENDLPNLGYTTVYPVATIAKILLAQLILIIFNQHL